MVAFELTFPNRGSWNGHWTGENARHVIFMNERPKTLARVGNSYIYDFGDGWVAQVTVSKVSGRSKEYYEIKKNNLGFCGYDWMVKSIIARDTIEYRTKGDAF